MKNISITALLVIVAIVGTIIVMGGSDESDNSSKSSDTKDSVPVVSGEAESLANSGLETVPMSLFDDNSITELDLSGNNLTGALPAEIRKLSNLEVLDASDNNLTGIPAEIGQLSKLRVINFANNDISGLPLELGNLSNLETLDLRGNPNVSTYDIGLIKPNIPQANILTD